MRFQHPDRYNARGDSKWNGVLYGSSLRGLCLDRPLIYSGTFGAGLFQCIYQPQPAHWAMLPSTLEWHLAIVLCMLATPLWPYAAMVALGMWLLSLLVAALLALQAKLPVRYDGPFSRLVVMFLCYAQPLVRSWHRQKTRLLSNQRSPAAHSYPAVGRPRIPLLGSHVREYWCDGGSDRLHLLGITIAHLNERRWSKTIDTGWERWDLDVLCHPWAVARITTVQEEHGEGKHLIRVRFQARPSGYMRALWLVIAAIALLGLVFWSWPVASVGAVLVSTALWLYWLGRRRVASTVSLVDAIADGLGFVLCDRNRTASAGGATSAPPLAPLDPCESND